WGMGWDSRDRGRPAPRDRVGGGPRPRAVLRATFGLWVQARYLLSDMAVDAAGLLDALGIASAHVVGVSMGGMIAQIMAARHASRVRTLTSIMSSSGERSLPPPRWGLRLALIRPPDAQGGPDAPI